MESDEKILLVIGGVALVALLIFDYAPAFQPMNGSTAPVPDAATDTGWNWQTYNAPYLFAPPVAGTLPTTAMGILGQAYGSGDDYSARGNPQWNA